MESSKTNMTLRRILTVALVLGLGVPVVFSLLPGCENSPAEPEFNNPFDPLDPDAGDPLKAQAEATNDTTVIISWNQPQGMGITRYVISSSAYRDSNYSFLGEKAHTEVATTSYPYSYPDPTTTHWFQVQAFAGLDYSVTSYATPDSATTGPRVIIGDGRGATATRYPNLEITVTEGDMLRIALDPTFTESLRIVPAGPPNEPINITYDIGPASDNNETRTIYVVSFGDGYESLPSSQSLRTDFKPAFTVVGNPLTVATRLVDLAIPTEGVVNMRFFAEWADTATTPWVPVSEIYTDYELSDSANPQQVRGQFMGDLGYDSLVEIQVTPDLLTSVTFALVLPDDHVTDQSVVPGASRAVATQMRYAESADFTNVPWIDYADTVQIQLSPTPGHKVIHAQYRNDWTQSGIYTDYVVHVTQAAEVSFWAPLDGDVVLAESLFQVRGGSTAGSGQGSVVLVRFDPGDGSGFGRVDGTDAWSTMWTVPRFTSDTQVTLRAEAFYGPQPDSLESVTTAITVTVTQLAVTITDPLEGADLKGNRAFNFTGTASPILGGAALDSVTIDIGNDHFPASGTANWSAEWFAPLWDADTTLTLAATSWAGGDTAFVSFDVNVVRPAVTFDPIPKDLVETDTDVTIAGVTFADLFTSPVESVVLKISSSAEVQELTATGTDNWSAVWHTPVVEANTATRIIALATAGSETRADTIAVIVKP